MSSQVLIVAAEASSSFLAQRLLENWKRHKKNIQAFGVGSDAMEKMGFERLGKSEEMAVVGAAEVIEHYGKLKSVFNSLVEAAAKRRPDFALVLDYPDFNLMLAKKLKALNIPVIYYVSPQVWAWRKGRVKKIKKYCEEIYVLFPFEMDFYQSQQMPVQFVGHPMLDEVQERYFNAADIQREKQQRHVLPNQILIGLMPGSRKGEIQRHLKMQMEVASRLVKNYPQVKIAVLTAPTFTKEQMQDSISTLMETNKNLSFPFVLLKDEPFEMIHICDYILVASGTATLMVGLMEKPMVIMYKMNWFTEWLATILVRGVKYFGLVNLILKEQAVPERWRSGANVEEIYQLMKRYIDEPSYTQQVIDKLKKLKVLLGDKGATDRVAQLLEKYFQK